MPPSTATVHGYHREEAFTHQVGDKSVDAAVAAQGRLRPVRLRFRLGEESTVGRNSRLLLGDGTIFWVGPHDDVVRPTGPFDPELPVLAFAQPGGDLEAVLFNHSTHTIGTIARGVRSPSFYGLAAQELEKERGGTFVFFEGASGSTHNLDVPTPEALRADQGRRGRCARSGRRAPGPARGRGPAGDHASRPPLRRGRRGCGRGRLLHQASASPGAERTIRIFREMRKELAPRQGEPVKTWVQAIVLGDIAVVGVPGELFTLLGQEIKRRSPYRYTYVFELANDYVGYLPTPVPSSAAAIRPGRGCTALLRRARGRRSSTRR